MRGLGPALSDLDRRPKTVVGHVGWHAHVHDGEVRTVHFHRFDERRRVADFGDHVSPASSSTWITPTRSRTASSADHDPHGISTITLVGPPVGLRTRIHPPSALTRSARPERPLPREESAPPTPSSRMSMTNRLFCSTMETSTLGGLSVFGDVGQSLGDHEVRGTLDRGRRSCRHVDHERHRYRSNE